MKTLVWFRSDLRVKDNTALSEACRAADAGVIGVFTICRRQWQEHDWGAAKVSFLLRNLAELSAALHELNIPLRLIDVPHFADVPKKLLALAQRHDCGGVWFNREYEVNEQARDQEVERVFAGANRSANAHHDQVVLPPDRVRTNDGGFYSVFSPYRNRWLETLEESGGVRCLQRPRRQKRIDLKSDSIPERLREFPTRDLTQEWPAGEDHAHLRLRSFVADRLKGYQECRNLPAENGTSTMSPYLACGVVSSRQCLQAAARANRGRLSSGLAGAQTWIAELIWREFYRHVLVGYPRVCRNRPFKLETEQIRWRRSERDFERWKQGRTGIPIVDAGMRQLEQTGGMHNRLRMIVAMFFTKNLFLDWRWGERYFMQQLVDGDFASNNGGWQWSASVGTDAAPYFRIFNPVSQSERFDPEGDFIRRYVPELQTLDEKAIHMPQERDADTRKKVGYPTPIVDLKQSRKKAIATFKKALKSLES